FGPKSGGTAASPSRLPVPLRRGRRLETLDVHDVVQVEVGGPPVLVGARVEKTDDDVPGGQQETLPLPDVVSLPVGGHDAERPLPGQGQGTHVTISHRSALLIVPGPAHGSGAAGHGGLLSASKGIPTSYAASGPRRPQRGVRTSPCAIGG